MRSSATLSAAALVAGASAQNYLGFNSGSTFADHSAKVKQDWIDEFNAAKNLNGAPGTFNSVRLYTNIQAGTEGKPEGPDPIEAFEAAMETKTNILLGVWASGTSNIDLEIAALSKAVSNKGKAFTDLVIGVSIGSEDLYRISATGVANQAGVGTSPDMIVKFIGDFKKAFANTALASTPIGHVDTWDVWPNATNKPVIDAVDWIGVDEYPYYEGGKGNDIKNSPALFDRAYDAATAAAGGKPVWLTETGWPVTGPNWDQAVPSVQNAKYFWDNIGCRRLFNQVPTFWYNLRDSNPDNKQKFAITDNLSKDAFFDLTCPTTFDVATTTSGSSKPTSASDIASGSGSGSGSNSNGASAANQSQSPGKNAATQATPAAYLAVLAVAAGLFSFL